MNTKLTKRFYKKFVQTQKSDDWETCRKQRTYCVSVGRKVLRSHLKMNVKLEPFIFDRGREEFWRINCLALFLMKKLSGTVTS